MSKTMKVDESKLTVNREDCCLWAGVVHTSRGYGVINALGTSFQAHRVIYENQVGEIPKGYHIDHLCMQPSCINVDHLEAVTPKENTNRAHRIYGIGIAKTHCVRGHEFNEENTYIYYNKQDNYNQRKCRLCGRLATAIKYYRKKDKKEGSKL